MSDTTDHLEVELRETRGELRETRAQLAELQAERKRERRRSRKLALWGVGVLAGRGLRASSRAWVAKLRERPGDLASDESADLLAAIARRVLRIGVFALVVAAFAILTPFVTLWQTFVIREQVDQQAEQNTMQAADNRIVRRAQLLATIYEEECQDSPVPAEGEAPAEGEDPPARICTPRSPLRARQEAVLAFVEIERGRGVRPNLRGAYLSEAHLYAADLRGAYLIEADLSGAVNLTQEQINAANGDSDTKLPESLTRPEDWKGGAGAKVPGL